jgi:hypothetical protein
MVHQNAYAAAIQKANGLHPSGPVKQALGGSFEWRHVRMIIATFSFIIRELEVVH